ncbi:hypothetical protein HispidOSU_022207, partial [Sigmodon hispidus]
MTVHHEGLRHTLEIQGGCALLSAHLRMPHATTLLNANLRTQLCGGQVPLLVLRVPAE